MHKVIEKLFAVDGKYRLWHYAHGIAGKKFEKCSALTHHLIMSNHSEYALLRLNDLIHVN